MADASASTGATTAKAIEKCRGKFVKASAREGMQLYDNNERAGEAPDVDQCID